MPCIRLLALPVHFNNEGAANLSTENEAEYRAYQGLNFLPASDADPYR